ncbi:uncharacterized protein LOC119839784 [Zerene cesonia]|uniref:uncharacterized protein LOC119839784 n=1 Tax=Zerene cesonia TaxID=33412 RepID=UPI0018E500DA|nr:uncharacterized protein LOC119839784 [Zerene cesonia]
MSKKIQYRDISDGLKKLRDILLGRKYNLHNRFPPFLAPRTIPPAEIPRCPDYKYSDQYYYERNAFDSVKPPIVAPVAEGPPISHDPTKKGSALKPDDICFNHPPTPGQSWWWDGHCYYEYVDDPPPKPVVAKPKTDRHCPQCPPSSSPPKK